MSQPSPFIVEELSDAPSALDVAGYTGDMARHLSNICETAGLHGLATLFYAAHSEAERATARLQGSSARKAATGDAA